MNKIHVIILDKERDMDSIIFDIDGTLWDTTGICARAWNDAINDNSELHASISAEQLKGLFGKPMDVIFASLFQGVSDELSSVLIEKCCEYEDRYLKEMDKKEFEPITFTGVIDTIKKLSEKFRLFIVSNCQKGYIEILIEKLGLEEYITDYLCFGDTLLSKGQTMRRLIEKNSLQAPVYVGDTLGDKQASDEAGIPFVFCTYGFGQVDEYYKSIDSFDELSVIF